ncbi:MAG: ferredoxin family protein [Candidatus Bathyarchaeia archaeon]
MVNVELLQEKCINCNTCIATCPMGVFEDVGGEIVVSRPGDCIACHACEAACPAEAITVSEQH